MKKKMSPPMPTITTVTATITITVTTIGVTVTNIVMTIPLETILNQEQTTMTMTGLMARATAIATTIMMNYSDNQVNPGKAQNDT